MPLNVLVIDRAPPVSLRQGNALIGMEVFSRLSRHHLTLVAPASPAEERDAAQLRGIFREIHLVPRRRWTPALGGSLEPNLPSWAPSVPGLDLAAARRLARAVGDLAAREQFDVLHVRQLPMSGYAGRVRASGRLLELIDSETLGAERARPATWRTGLRAKLAAVAERRAMRRFDIVTAVADADAARLRVLRPAARVEVVPNGVDVHRFRPDPDTVPDPSSLVFLGAMSFPPNVAAMRYFTTQVLPLVLRRRSDVRLTIVGRDPAAEVRAMASPSVTVTGEVEDVRPYLAAASVFVAPMVSGSGIKNKVLEAMAMARPVVATSLAVEGLPVRVDQDAIVADSPDAMATAILGLLADDRLRTQIGGAGRALVEERYTWERCAERYEALYEELARRRGRDR